MDERVPDGVVAGVAGGIVGGVPSTVYALVRRLRVAESAQAAGALVLPGERRGGVLVAVGVPVHLGVSWGGE